MYNVMSAASCFMLRALCFVLCALCFEFEFDCAGVLQLLQSLHLLCSHGITALCSAAPSLDWLFKFGFGDLDLDLGFE